MLIKPYVFCSKEWKVPESCDSLYLSLPQELLTSMDASNTSLSDYHSRRPAQTLYGNSVTSLSLLSKKTGPITHCVVVYTFEVRDREQQQVLIKFVLGFPGVLVIQMLVATE